MNNINNDINNKKITEVEEKIKRMNTRDLIELQSSLLDLSFHPAQDDFTGVNGENYGKFNISFKELLKIVNKFLIGKETCDWLECAVTPFPDDLEKDNNAGIKKR